MFSIAALCLATFHPPPAWSARIKCWTNDQGVRECGNVVPPKYSQKGHSEVGKHGITVKTQKRAKTKAEVAAERRRTEELAARKTEQERRAREQAFRDRVLLDTFTTEEDLSLAHKGHVATIDSRIQHTRQIIARLEGELAKLRSQAAAQERAGRPVSAAMQANIAGTQKRIAENRSFIEQRHREKKQLQRRYQEDLERFRVLKRRGG